MHIEEQRSALKALRTQIQGLETSRLDAQAVLSFDVPAMDVKLHGGLALGALHEVGGGGNGAVHSAAATLFAAGVMARLKGQVLWCMKQRDLFAPALAFVGLDLERVIFVEAGDDKKLLACFEEGLRHGSVAGVVCEISKMSLVASRRLQLAAEHSGAIGIALRRWFRPQQEKDWEATVARTRWRITTLPSTPLPVQGIGHGQWHLELLRCRSGESSEFFVESCNEKGYLALSTNTFNRSLETLPPQHTGGGQTISFDRAKRV